MKDNVYFINFRSDSERNNIHNKIKRLFEKSGMKNVLTEGDLTAIKVHFGEKGRHAYLHPTFVRQIVDKVKEYGANPFLTDTNTLYTGSRTNSVIHMNTAIENGFAYSVVNAPIIIADGVYSKNSIDVEINKKHCKTAKIAGDIYNSNSMIVLSHVKGHGMAGFGGTIKNLAMGCASASGKQIQHSDAKPRVTEEKCISCGICIKNCPVNAIEMKKKAFINHDICIGCGECTTVCPKRAIDVQWETDDNVFLEKMAEYAYGAVKDKKGKIGYINFIMNVTPLCDCVPWNDTPIVNDIGILASFDPVAIDKASIDLIDQALGNKNSKLSNDYEIGTDKFRSIHNIDGKKILDYCEEIGLGNKKYELIEIK
ncbi:DUF362 domain-containing protein [Clostridium sp. D2Q-14]|uniref:DUF362 domain-containing protein n=1 Tax=Anaeromonas gelatinilytica TaxID=2683194 RepID=UPI00193BF296|nr:DUF362 domain-containing protein [Anaeromonas gelatinilytica]MBS4536597.1 DUF362 domain-containing protein [Anaeromonas gelatinilytica]